MEKIGSERVQKSRRKFYEYLYTQWRRGLLTDPDKIALLRNEGYIKDITEERIDPTIRAMEQRMAEDWTKAMDPYAQSKLYSAKKITDAAWKPRSVIHHDESFRKWINSFLYGSFLNKTTYKPFEYYKAQSYVWLQDKDNITSYKTQEEKRAFIFREYERCQINTLYFADKYGELKEGDASSGIVDYKAREHHAIIFYLHDCGYNIIGGKGRQIGFTSAMGLIAIKNLVFKSNYYIKFVTEDKDTGEEIFTDKIKYPFGALPKWIQPPVKSDSGTRFWLSDKKKKGEQGYPNSRVDVIAPKKTAINGGSPQLVLIDEIGNIGILGAMLNEGRPTMFWNNPETGEFELKRQVAMWGTGGSMDRGKGAYEKEWYRILGLWEEGNYESGFVPIFFSWHARFSSKEYDKERSWYYGARATERDIDLETSKTQFHQHYPSTFKDMFLTTSNTLVSRDIIEEGLEKCRNLSGNMKPVYGYFEPIFDTNSPIREESDVPYRITGANFVPVDDYDITSRATVVMFQKPELGWKHRYYQGTDPIATESGHSKFASSIWDDYYKTVSCQLNFRRQHDHKYAFLQALLMGLYYDTSIDKKGVPELVEANIGTNYIDYVESKGFGNRFVFNAQLPANLRGGQRLVGVDKKGNRASAIIDYLTDVIRTYHKRIYILTIFDQLTTFVFSITASGKETWGPLNKMLHYDDALDSLAYAYICRLCFSHLSPTQSIAKSTRTRIKYKMVRDANMNLVRMPVKEIVPEEVTDDVLPDFET